MNKKGQEINLHGILSALIAILIIAIITPAFTSMFQAITSQNCPKCESCNYWPYQSNLSFCIKLVDNLTEQLNQTPVKYIQNITYINVTRTIEKPVCVDKPAPITINVVSFLFSLFLTINLFRIKIKLPKEIENELKNIKKWIKILKWCSFAVSILRLLRLIWIFITLI